MLTGVAIHRPTFNLVLTVVEEEEPIPRARLTRMLLDVAAWDPQLTSTEYGLSGYEFQRPVGRFRPDFCWVREWLIVECDGFDGHGRRHAQSEADKARDAELTSQGWLVMRFTWHQITQRSAWVASSIRATRRRRAVQLGLNP